MPAPKSDRPAERVKFVCLSCAHDWTGEPSRVDDNPDAPWHPYTYFAHCPECTEESAQCVRQRASWKGAAAATGPRTAEGKAKSASNLDGHPTDEQMQTARFNALKTGKHASVAQFFPAKPGKYAECEHCPYYAEFGGDEQQSCVQFPLHGHINDKWCKQRLELWAVFQRAFEDRDPGQLASLNADMQFANHALMEQMRREILVDGVALKSPEWASTADGIRFVKYENPETGEITQLMDVRAHPLLKPYLEMLSRNKLSMDDMGMTARHSPEDDAIQGHLADTGEDDTEYMKRQESQLAAMQDLIARSREAKLADPVVKATPALEGPKNDA